ncbi:MAG: carbohydrate kinase [Chitinophagaceae bacterium]|nr:carbohydrate kinase [Chitinophagaceae bacterium]
MEAVLVFDIGKTNKKWLLFNQHYQVIAEHSIRIPELLDEDGFPCDDVQAITNWIRSETKRLKASSEYSIKAINFSGYGASFVYLDQEGKQIGPLYNYLKPLNPSIHQTFFRKYGDEVTIAQETASPILDLLNSGLQLVRLKNEHPDFFHDIHTALHLPQYLSYVLTGLPVSELTSIGCHTLLWNFEKRSYHDWVSQEELDDLFPPIVPSNNFFEREEMKIGVGLHDSSAALIPYLFSFQTPFVLISTGTWSISLNPFNRTVLKKEELKQDVLAYLSFDGNAVKAARLFLGAAHEEQLSHINTHFKRGANDYQSINFNANYLNNLKSCFGEDSKELLEASSGLHLIDWRACNSFEEAYHQLLFNLVELQKKSTDLVLHNSPVDCIFVDGGFSHNQLFMQFLKRQYPEKSVYAATVAQASALGAALVLHQHWNQEAIPEHLIETKPISI